MSSPTTNPYTEDQQRHLQTRFNFFVDVLVDNLDSPDCNDFFSSRLTKPGEIQFFRPNFLKSKFIDTLELCQEDTDRALGANPDDADLKAVRDMVEQEQRQASIACSRPRRSCKVPERLQPNFDPLYKRKKPIRKRRKVAAKRKTSAVCTQQVSPYKVERKILRSMARFASKKGFGTVFELSVQQSNPSLWPIYSRIVDCPMDLGTLRKRLMAGYYTHLPQQLSSSKFLEDVRLVWTNCILFNGLFQNEIYVDHARKQLRRLKKKLTKL